MKATFDISTPQGKIRLFNAQQAGGVSMKNLDDGTIINATDIVQYPTRTDEYGAEQEVTVTTIFDESGLAYSSISQTVCESASALIDLVADIKLTEYAVRVQKNKSSKGQEFINISLAM